MSEFGEVLNGRRSWRGPVKNCADGTRSC